MSDWECAWSGRLWKHSSGGVIEKGWTLVGKVQFMFFCYKNANDFYAGNNFTTKQTLRSAKAAIESNVKNGDE